ncbi:hypothetical protein HYR99_13200 [Candidatus Poribacteria bacterium]|nr:hypothetical protein [Candidatus Poribacteria bacterium]
MSNNVTLEQQLKDIDNKLDAEWRDLSKIKPARHDDIPGITTCFVFAGTQHPFPVAYQDLDKIASLINRRIPKKLKEEGISGWKYVPHKVPHVTASSVINPRKENEEIPEIPETSSHLWGLMWNTLVKSVGELVEYLPRINFIFCRIQLTPNGSVLLAGYPDREEVGQFKELMYLLFKAERAWDYAGPAPVIGHFKPCSDNTSCDESGNFSFPFSEIQDLLPSVWNDCIGSGSEKRIAVEDLWLIHYSNRLIDPTKGHVLHCRRFPLLYSVGNA